ncbi:MAG: menaquinone-dependent protoporphyrinogen oxidase [Chloroflexi bacterium]|nr:MAG: menaquinone-dependent protoporphyrinogen oxidase [Chloroflexota bacterium]MBA4376755.1 hypothetical protein [Anaerolinea sp.]
MEKTQVIYITHSGTTQDVAKAVSEEVIKTGVEAGVLPAEHVKRLTGYSAVVLGAPMIMGWHRRVLKFLRQHKPE